MANPAATGTDAETQAILARLKRQAAAAMTNLPELMAA